MATKHIVWTYQERREYEFSPRIFNAQRLPNGNTLVCEGDFGRLFEVTREGEVVWEYVNPFFGDRPTRGSGHQQGCQRLAEPILCVGCGTGWRMTACGSHLVNVSNVRSRGG